MESRKYTSHSKQNAFKRVARKFDRKKILDEMIDQRLYSIEEVTILFDISAQSLRRAIANKRINTVRIGRCIRFRSDDLKKISEGNNLFLNSKEASQILNIPLLTLRNHLKNGVVKGIRFADKGEWRIPKSEIDRLTQEGFTSIK